MFTCRSEQQWAIGILITFYRLTGISWCSISESQCYSLHCAWWTI